MYLVRVQVISTVPKGCIQSSKPRSSPAHVVYLPGFSFPPHVGDYLENSESHKTCSGKKESPAQPPIDTSRRQPSSDIGSVRPSVVFYLITPFEQVRRSFNGGNILSGAQ
jgi:hypothetical protein